MPARFTGSVLVGSHGKLLRSRSMVCTISAQLLGSCLVSISEVITTFEKSLAGQSTLMEEAKRNRRKCTRMRRQQVDAQVQRSNAFFRDTTVHRVKPVL
jgi:hypothetical protein